MRRFDWAVISVCGFVTLITLAACGNGGTSGPTPFVATTAAPLSTSVAISQALAQQPLATSVPAPSGFAQTFSAAFVTVPANTTLSIKEGTAVPNGVPALSIATSSGGGVATLSKSRPQSAGVFNTVFYDVVSPSASMTVSGAVSVTESFPQGTLSSGSGYYLGFYDGSQPSATWQTIAGPVLPSSNSLTFSGTIGSFTLQAGINYGFAIFTLSGSSTPPPSQAQDEAYLSQGTSGILIYNTSGNLVNTLAINSTALGLDDNGNVYALYTPAFTPGTVPNYQPQKFPAGSTTASATYQGSATSNANATGPNGFVSSSGAGEVASAYFTTETIPGDTGIGAAIDVWKAGSAGGAPDYTLTADQSFNFTYDLQHDGTIYLSQNTGGVASYLVFPPGGSTPSRTISETIVPAGQQSNFSPNYMTVGPDGTVYVTEYSVSQPDPLSGLYIYPPNGPEKFVALDSNANGTGAFGVDVDAAGNIYVAVSNAGFNCSVSCTPQGDSLNEIEVLAPGGTSVLRRIHVANPIAIVTAPDGTVFISSFPATPGLGTTATFVATPGATTATELTPQAETNIVLYNGYQESAASLRRHTSFSAVTAAARGGSASLMSFFRMTHRKI